MMTMIWSRESSSGAGIEWMMICMVIGQMISESEKSSRSRHSRTAATHCFHEIFQLGSFTFDRSSIETAFGKDSLSERKRNIKIYEKLPESRSNEQIFACLVRHYSMLFYGSNVYCSRNPSVQRRNTFPLHLPASVVQLVRLLSCMWL